VSGLRGVTLTVRSGPPAHWWWRAGRCGPVRGSGWPGPCQPGGGHQGPGGVEGPAGHRPTRPEIDIVWVSNNNQGARNGVVSKNHDYPRQLALRTRSQSQELQRYCRLPGHADGPSGSFAVAEGSAPTRNDGRCRGWSGRRRVASARGRPSLRPRSRVVTGSGSPSLSAPAVQCCPRTIRVERRAARWRPTGIREHVQAGLWRGSPADARLDENLE
jgi:hypothetical protein